jgi:hypothetical protein
MALLSPGGHAHAMKDVPGDDLIILVGYVGVADDASIASGL